MHEVINDNNRADICNLTPLTMMAARLTFTREKIPLCQIGLRRDYVVRRVQADGGDFAGLQFTFLSVVADSPSCRKLSFLNRSATKVSMTIWVR